MIIPFAQKKEERIQINKGWKASWNGFYYYWQIHRRNELSQLAAYS